MKDKIVFIGGGDLAKSILNYIHESMDFYHYEVVGYFDDSDAKWENFKKIGNFVDYKNISASSNYKVIIALGYKHLALKEEISNELINKHIELYSFVHPTCYIHPTVKMGHGNILFPRVCLDQGVQLGNCNLLNISVTIAHDSKLKDCCFLSPCVNIAGFVSIESRCFLGINSTVIDNKTITKDSIIGANSLILKNIDLSGKYVGSPVKRLESK